MKWFKGYEDKHSNPVYKHVLTDAGLDQFDKDWAAVQSHV